VKAPGFGDNRKATLQDIAVLTGGQVRCFVMIDLYIPNMQHSVVRSINEDQPPSLSYSSILIYFPSNARNDKPLTGDQ
jgi:chaperonin GroEL (HSP60 family)